jgi:protein-S-isoprenylcysteine O-methyltransferase Ste14
MAGMVAIGFLCLGLLDYDTFVFHSQARFLLVLGLLIGSSILGTWAFFTFNLRTTIGLGDKLIIKGPYRYSRNPQYISDSLSIFAFMILTNSILVWILGFLAITLNILAPFTEEPWLEEKFGTSYLEYKSRVPRFIGLATRT